MKFKFLFMLLLLVSLSFGDKYDRAQLAWKEVPMSLALSTGTGLALVGMNHLLGTNKKIDDGWLFVLPFLYATYKVGDAGWKTYEASVGIKTSF